LPKRKVAILMGFRGTGYYGMQLWVILNLFIWDNSSRSKHMYIFI
jgi:hypothetical protein